MQVSKFNSEWASPAAFVSYLREVLVPDLRDSGSDATADDFEDAATFIEALASGPAKLAEVLEAAEVRQSQWGEVADGRDPGDVIDELYEAGAEEAYEHASRQAHAIASVREFYTNEEG